MRKTIAALAVLALAGPARAWEADTTHAGLTEAAALGSRLHARLQTLHGRKAGWLELLVLLPDRAAELYKKLEIIEPSSGVVPDRRGRQSALSWLVAGAVLEGVPGDRDRNHFYEPTSKKGLRGGGVGLAGKLRGGDDLPGGMAAPDWIGAKDNDLGLARFWLELERSATAPTRGERDEHLALALVCAGAMLHVLQDMGVPAHVRNDAREHLLPLGGGPADRGSRFERLAAFLHGRLGLPDPTSVPTYAHARDFLVALAEATAKHYYSAGTLPGDVIVPSDPKRGQLVSRVAGAQRFPEPRPTVELSTREARNPDGHVIRDADGPCLANYRVEAGVMKFAISDACATEQIAAILPTVSGYSRGLLEWLFRGGLSVVVAAGDVVVSVPEGEPRLGKGKLTVLVEEDEGRRTPVGSVMIEGPGPLPAIAAPPGAGGKKKVIAVFRGVDAEGEEIVAVGSAEL